MQDFIGEGFDEERERETVDALAEHETFEHHRGDDRACEQLRSYLELFARGASLPSNRGQDTKASRPNGGGHMQHPLLSQPPVSGDSAPGDAGEHDRRAA